MTAPTRETWMRLDSVFEEARTLSAEDRAAFLARLRQGDRTFADELEGLLRSSDAAGSFLETPVTAGSASGIEGALIGGCRVVRRLGHGGMGAVYEAVQESIGRRVAIKVMRASFAGPDERQRFQYEARWLGQLRHPGVAQVFEVGEHRDGALGLAFPYCVMELVPDARAITAYVRQNALDLRGTIRLFLQVCDAVQHAHARGIIHRDLKPANVLVDAAGQPKLIDFGVARHADLETPRPFETDTGAVVGTLGYMSPEQIAGSRDAIDIRTDVWALGVILFELITGELPIPVASLPLVEALARFRTDAARPLSQLRPELRGELEVVIQKALSRTQEDRYASVTTFSDDLERFLRDEPVLARRPTFVQSLRLFARRHAAAVATAAIVALILVAATVVSLVFAFRTDEARRSESEKKREAERERASAQALVDRGRHFANWMIFEFQNRLLAIDGATDAKRELGASLVSYLDDIAKIEGGDRHVALEIARAYTQLGSLAGHPYRGGGGDTDAALAHYRKAIASLDSIASTQDAHDIEAQRTLIRFRMAEVLSQSDPPQSFALLEEVHLAAEKLRLNRPGDLQIHALEADVAWFTGDSHERAGNAAAALTARDRALVALDQLFAVDAKVLQAEPIVGRNLFELRVKHADLLMRRERLDDARRTAEALVAEARDAADATSLRARNDVAIAARTLGAIAARQGDHHAAARAYERAAVTFEGMFAANPQNPGYLELAVRNHFGRATALKSCGDHAGAIDASRRALELHDQHLEKRLTSVLERRKVREMWILQVESAEAIGDAAVIASAWTHALEASDRVIASPRSDPADRRFGAMIARRAGVFAEKRAERSTESGQSAILLREARDRYARALTIIRELLDTPAANEKDRANAALMTDEVERLDDRIAAVNPDHN